MPFERFLEAYATQSLCLKVVPAQWGSARGADVFFGVKDIGCLYIKDIRQPIKITFGQHYKLVIGGTGLLARRTSRDWTSSAKRSSDRDIGTRWVRIQLKTSCHSISMAAGKMRDDLPER
ncbi:hypothetical protein AVEN_103747-1 [Araneus ventricosus]|uniref:Uncharacterized protein n=1 Tax=Araneus ventricosus TaxID=182803 RepID=A0A4Y2QHJ3_ARAVE|nr:hypothetical protein AVEN_103747-1 [Araneus ventricosus]